MSVNHVGNVERRPAASTTKSACTSSPASVRTPTTCGTPAVVASPLRQTNHTDTPPNIEIFGRRDHVRDGGFRDRPTGGHRVVTFVSLTEATGDLGRRVTKRIDDQRACIQERSDYVGRIGLHHLPIARLEKVQQAELIHTPPLPPLPGSFRVRGRRRIPFQDRDLMAITGQHQRGTQPYDPASNHHDPSHRILLIGTEPRPGATPESLAPDHETPAPATRATPGPSPYPHFSVG